MSARLSTFWDNLRSSLWFVPAIMTLGAIGLSFVTIHIDHQVEAEWVRTVGWLWAGGVEGARAVLSTIAGSFITVAGVTFSITITALTLASSQFGPRLLRNFMRDTGNQLVLGTFIATFLYCLLVLRTVRSVEENRFVPYISVSVGLLLALVSLGVLIYFIHHMADSIQADNLASAVAEELHESIDRLFPEKLGQSVPAKDTNAALPEEFAANACSLAAWRSGYVQSLDSEKLLRLACERDLLVRLCRRPGDFVARGGHLAQVWPPQQVNDALKEELQSVFVLGRHRTSTQDAEFSIHQLVEIAVRALSPSINDPRTAITCIDWLGESLGRLAEREMPQRLRRDDSGKLRVVVATPVTFENFAAAVFHQIRQYGASSVAVTLHLLKTIAEVATHTRQEPEFAILRRHADLIAADGCAQAANESDRAAIEACHRVVLQALTGEAV